MQRELSIRLSVTAALRPEAVMQRFYAGLADSPNPAEFGHETKSGSSRFGGRIVASSGNETRVWTVASYRLYCLDGVNKVASAEWIEADGDEAAIEAATARHDGYECEVWQGRRLVARLDLRREA